MRLMVCPRTNVSAFVDAPVTHFVSLIDPDEGEVPEVPRKAMKSLQLVFSDLDDIEMQLPKFAKYSAPQDDHVAELVDFGRSLGGLDDWGLLAHCEAGISRSTAASIAILTAAGYPPQTAFGIVRRVCPEMLPNRRILRLADKYLGTNGRLYQMAENHRRKAFLRAGYEDPTNVLLAEAHAEASRPKTLLDRIFGVLPTGWRTLVGSGARMRAALNTRDKNGHSSEIPSDLEFGRVSLRLPRL
ncbi:MAG: hypothetical protein ACOYNN_02945 [Terrimicrobiaceae bacterium]